MVADARGRFVRGCLTPGQRHDAPQALPLLADLAPAYLIADRGYDADPLVAVRGTVAVIPPRRKRRPGSPALMTPYATPSGSPSNGSSAASSSFAAWPRATISWMPIF